jgi:hypothetical protein
VKTGTWRGQARHIFAATLQRREAPETTKPAVPSGPPDYIGRLEQNWNTAEALVR